MPGKVFVSCGQNDDEERTTARKVCAVLIEEKLDPYVAVATQTLDDVMSIVRKLAASDYFLFIDSLRQPDAERGGCHIPISLFAHQELALAHHLGFKENAIFLQQENAPRAGFLAYILGNSERFSDDAELLTKVRQLIRDRAWSKNFSRHLLVGSFEENPPSKYYDHTVYIPNNAPVHKIWQATIQNRRPDEAALGAVCILDRIKELASDRELPCPDRSHLKWAEHYGMYEMVIPPQYTRKIDLFAVQQGYPGLFLHSLRDLRREPFLEKAGNYELFYKVFTHNFPALEFSVNVKLGEPRSERDVFQDVQADLKTQ